MNCLRHCPNKSPSLWGLKIKPSPSQWHKIPKRGLIQGSEKGHVFQSPIIRMTPKMIGTARFTKKIGWRDEAPVFMTRSEYLGMMTVMRVKFNMVALVFFLCLVFSIIHKGRELKKKGHNLDDCSEEKVVMLRLKYLLELKEERDKFDLAAKANKS